MIVQNFQQSLESSVKNKLQLKVNDNRSTMLSVNWEPDCTKVSLHRMFLHAPQNIMDDLACYLRQEPPTLSPSLKSFINTNLNSLNYSKRLDSRKLCTLGATYDLQALYEALNDEYFENTLQLNITWFGRADQRNKKKVTFGLYYEPLRLIKINKMLDQPLFPEFFIAYVIYHEMVHHFCPSYVDKSGIHRIHNEQFKAQEKKFKDYALAQEWIKNHQHVFFE